MDAHHIVVISILILLLPWANGTMDLDRMNRGRTGIEVIRSRAASINYGGCWKEVLKDLDERCSHLSEESQSHIAISLTNCFQQVVGGQPLRCSKLIDTKDCLKDLSASEMNTFRDFFLHAADMCFYIKHQIWSEETDKAVTELKNTAATVTKNLEDSLETQDQILKSQKEALEAQENLRNDNNKLKSSLSDVKLVFEEFREVAVEQQHTVFDMFTKIEKIQKLISYIQDELNLFDMVMFYFCLTVTILVSTTFERSKNARFPLLFLLSGMLVLEKTAVAYATNKEPYFLKEECDDMVRLYRECGSAILIAIFAIIVYKYENIHNLNNQLLDQMKTDMNNIFRELKEARGQLQGIEAYQTRNLFADLSDSSDSTFQPSSAELNTSTDSYSDDDEEDLENEIVDRSLTTLSLNNQYSGYLTRRKSYLS